MAVLMDISEHKRIDRMKDEFIGLVSHELRTPLAVIIGSLRSAMSAGVSPEDAHELIQNAVEGAESLAAMLENMLELSRYHAGCLNLNIAPITISSAARSVVQKLKGQGMHQHFTLDFPDNLPLVKADLLRVERVLYNLIENATKYSPRDSEIKVSGQKEGDFIITRIIDQGGGISPSNQDKLFTPFEQLHNDINRTSGIGLGLAVCKRLVEAQGGWVKLSSESGKGSTFYFALPIHRIKA